MKKVPTYSSTISSVKKILIKDPPGFLFNKKNVKCFSLSLHVPQLVQNVVCFQDEAQLPRDKLAPEGAAAVAQLRGNEALEVAGAAVSVLLQCRRFLQAAYQLFPATWPLPACTGRSKY